MYKFSVCLLWNIPKQILIENPPVSQMNDLGSIISKTDGCSCRVLKGAVAVEHTPKRKELTDSWGLSNRQKTWWKSKILSPFCPVCSWLLVMQNATEECRLDFGAGAWIVGDATLQAGQPFHYLPRCQSHEIRAWECHGIWKLRLFAGQATLQMKGLIWGAKECNSNSAATADGTL